MSALPESVPIAPRPSPFPTLLQPGAGGPEAAENGR
jgi:hypothetical protein